VLNSFVGANHRKPQILSYHIMGEQYNLNNIYSAKKERHKGILGILIHVF